MNSKDKNKEKRGQWSYKQDLHYYYFLFLHADLLHSNKKACKFFILMSKFMSNKTPCQCRSHHNKKIKAFKTKNKVLQQKIIDKFYYENFTLRLLNKQQLKAQLIYFLQQKEEEYQKKIQNKFNEKNEKNQKENLQIILKIRNLRQKLQQKINLFHFKDFNSKKQISQNIEKIDDFIDDLDNFNMQIYDKSEKLFDKNMKIHESNRNQTSFMVNKKQLQTKQIN